MMYGDRSWLKPKRPLTEGRYVLDRWGRLLPLTRENRLKAVMIVRVRRKHKPNLVTPARAVSRFRELCAEATGE